MTAKALPAYQVKRLAWCDPEYGEIAMPKRPMRLGGGFGSGLSVREGDPQGTVWAICDRGPNLKIETAVERYGATAFEDSEGAKSAKIMPRLDIGPAIAELRILDDAVELVRTIRISDAQGVPISGLPIPAGTHAQCEPALDLDGKRLDPDPEGIDSEGLTALADGSFWVADEYGPSLLRVDKTGRVELRLTPQGVALPGADYSCRDALPAIAAKRQLNRGFEAISVSPGEKWLFLAFQSPLAHPDKATHDEGSHVRIWKLASDGAVAAQYLYPLDPPERFRRDCAKGDLALNDIKVSEIATLGEDGLLVLERGSETTKIYRVHLDTANELPREHFDEATRPTVEQMSGAGALTVPVLEKQLIFDTDEAPQIAADLEGMAILSPSELLLVNDNDFGVEGAETSFWLIRFDAPLFA